MGAMKRGARGRAAWVAVGAFSASVLVTGAALAATRMLPLPRPRPLSLAKPLPALRPAVPLPRKRPMMASLAAHAHATVELSGMPFASRLTIKPGARPDSGPFAVAPTSRTPAADIAALKEVIALVRKNKDGAADGVEKAIKDPVAHKLAEWIILRGGNPDIGFQRYADFIKDNPAWPNVPLFRRRAENALWDDGIEDAAVLGFFAHSRPTTAKGHYVLAHALLAKGDRAGAAALVRYAWRHDNCSEAVENKVIEMFGALLTPADHKARMERSLYGRDVEAGLRAAHRAGGSSLAIARAWAAVINDAHNAGALLHDVPASARGDPGYIFARVRWLRHNDKIEEAARLMLAAPRDAQALIDLDAWWRERRILVRELLDRHDPRTAYRLAREAATPSRDVYRADKYFTAGWIALRFLHDPKTAAALFAEIPKGTRSPHVLSRGRYWQGRAAEAMGLRGDAKVFYETAAKHSATYYGQLARVRLGLDDLGLHGPPKFTAAQRKVYGNLEVVRAVEILYALDERNLLASIFAEIGETGNDIGGMSAMAEVARKHGDGRAMVLLGEAAVRRGLPFDYYAYPVVGLPAFKPIAPSVGPAMTYAIARQESRFNQDVTSPARAVGLMQVTPMAGKDTARRYKVHYSHDRLRNDAVYNLQMGTAQLSHLLHYFHGSYLLSFAAYNAGLGRVRQWMDLYGDPRDPSVDPVDWVERLPYSETRNYVMRTLENFEVYRARFRKSDKLLIEADLRRGGGE